MKKPRLASRFSLVGNSVVQTLFGKPEPVFVVLARSSQLFLSGTAPLRPIGAVGPEMGMGLRRNPPAWHVCGGGP